MAENGIISLPGSFLSMPGPTLDTRVTCPGKGVICLEVLGAMSLSMLDLSDNS